MATTEQFLIQARRLLDLMENMQDPRLSAAYDRLSRAVLNVEIDDARRNEALARQLPEWATRRRPVLSAVEIVGLMETRYDVRRLCSFAVTE